MLTINIKNDIWMRCEVIVIDVVVAVVLRIDVCSWDIRDSWIEKNEVWEACLTWFDQSLACRCWLKKLFECMDSRFLCSVVRAGTLRHNKLSIDIIYLWWECRHKHMYAQSLAQICRSSSVNTGLDGHSSLQLRKHWIDMDNHLILLIKVAHFKLILTSARTNTHTHNKHFSLACASSWNRKKSESPITWSLLSFAWSFYFIFLLFSCGHSQTHSRTDVLNAVYRLYTHTLYYSCFFFLSFVEIELRAMRMFQREDRHERAHPSVTEWLCVCECAWVRVFTTIYTNTNISTWPSQVNRLTNHVVFNAFFSRLVC